MANERTTEIVQRLTSVVELMETTHREGCPYFSSQAPYGMDQCDCFVLVNKAALVSEIGRLRLDAENGWAARDHWKKKCEAKDAVVEAARELEHIHADHAECRDVDDAICRCTLCIALRALDKPTCKTCGGSGELKDAVQAWDIPGAPIPECPDCGGE